MTPRVPTVAIARKLLVDVSVTRWYHCVARWARDAFLLGGGRKDKALPTGRVRSVAVRATDDHCRTLLPARAGRVREANKDYVTVPSGPT
jgi:hypothetical protein